MDLNSAVDKCDLIEVIRLIDCGVDVNAQHREYGNALQLASSKKDQAIVRLLLDRGADVNAQGGEFGNALQASVFSSKKESIVRLLLDRGADVNAQGGQYGNALQAAAAPPYEDEAIIRLLLDQGADINAQGGQHGSALQAAAFVSENEAIIRLLVDRGADVNAQGGQYGSALQAAAFESKNEAIVRLLVDRGADINAQGGQYGNALQAASYEGNVAIVELLIDSGADCTIQPWSSDRMSLLHCAVLSTEMSILQHVLSNNGASHLESINSDGQTPLHLAVTSNHIEMAKYLIEKGASANTKDITDMSMLQSAVHGRHLSMALLLYPHDTNSLCLFTASNWRDLFLPISSDLEVTGGEKPEIRPIQNLEDYLSKLLYPLPNFSKSLYLARNSHFMNHQRQEKRMFILTSGNLLQLQHMPFRTHCHWWRKVKDQGKADPSFRYLYPDDEWVWRVQKDTVPSPAVIRQSIPDSCFLESGMYVKCLVLPLSGEDNGSDADLHPLNTFESTHGFFWVMVKPDHGQTTFRNDSTLLETCTSFHTTECAEIPASPLHLLMSLLAKLRVNWTHNHAKLQNRLMEMRSQVLKSSGTNARLIEYLIKDAQLIEDLTTTHDKQIQTIRSFQSEYSSDAWRVTYEEPLEDVRQRLSDVQIDVDIFDRKARDEIKVLNDISRNIIQLEFNLTAIKEAQKSTSTNRSLKRLSWVTFIFLPLLFVASLFGMNINILENGPAWWWYIPIASGTLFSTLAVWVLFKRSNTLEGTLENKFKWLLRVKEKRDLEEGIAS